MRYDLFKPRQASKYQSCPDCCTGQCTVVHIELATSWPVTILWILLSWLVSTLATAAYVNTEWFVREADYSEADILKYDRGGLRATIGMASVCRLQKNGAKVLESLEHSINRNPMSENEKIHGLNYGEEYFKRPMTFSQNNLHNSEEKNRVYYDYNEVTYQTDHISTNNNDWIQIGKVRYPDNFFHRSSDASNYNPSNEVDLKGYGLIKTEMNPIETLDFEEQSGSGEPIAFPRIAQNKNQLLASTSKEALPLDQTLDIGRQRFFSIRRKLQSTSTESNSDDRVTSNHSFRIHADTGNINTASVTNTSENLKLKFNSQAISASQQATVTHFPTHVSPSVSSNLDIIYLSQLSKSPFTNQPNLVTPKSSKLVYETQVNPTIKSDMAGSVNSYPSDVSKSPLRQNPRQPHFSRQLHIPVSKLESSGSTFRVPGHPRSLRHVNPAPEITETTTTSAGSPMQLECSSFEEDFPNSWWQVSFVLFGIGCVLLTWCAILAFCDLWVVGRGSRRVLAALVARMQVVAVILQATALLLFPLSLSSSEARAICGESAEPFRTADCRLGWAYVAAITSTILACYCPLLAHFSHYETIRPCRWTNI